MTSVVRIAAAADIASLRHRVAVVGSGAGALTIAGELSRHGVDVLLLEAGPVIGSELARHRRNFISDLDTFNAELRDCLRPHANAAEPWPGLTGAAGVHGVGGMMTYWANAVPRPQPLEWDGPMPMAKLGALLDDADKLLWSTEQLYGDGSSRQRWIRSTLRAHFGEDLTHNNRIAARRREDGSIELAGGDTLLAGAVGAISVVPNAIVRRVHRSGGAVDRLEVATKAGESFRVEADTFIVAAGVVGTPQLLVASGFGELPALGGYLTDHLNAVTRVLLKIEDAPSDLPDDPPLGMYFPVSEARPFHSSVLDIPSSAHAGILAGCEHLRSTDIGAFIGTEPVAGNRLYFDNANLDAHGMPSVRAEMRLTEADHERAGLAMKWQYDIARIIGEPWQGMTPMLRPIGSSLHMMGTYRMGSDSETSVTDVHCRVWGHDNLYLAGNGLLPSRNSCNPTLTTVALGLGAARAILADLGQNKEITIDI